MKLECVYTEYDELNIDTCKGSWKNCEGSNCEYHASWQYDEMTDDITFTLTVRQEQNKWAAIGFSPDRNMVIYFLLCSKKLCSDQIVTIMILSIWTDRFEQTV